MKLWELVPCWGSQPSGATPPAPSSPSPPEETQELMRRSQPAGGRSKRSSGAWKPSLGAIGEDHAAALVNSPAARSRRVVDSTGGQNGGAARRSRPTRPARPSPHLEKEHHGYAGVAVVVPAFTPTAFLF